MANCRALQRVESLKEEEGYATVCVTFKPEDVPAGFLRRVLSIAASKIGNGNVGLASHVMVIVNVAFKGHVGHLSSDVLLLKSPKVLLVNCAGEEGTREYR